jgi:hypothetical protein
MLLKIIAEISCRNKVLQRDSLVPIGSGFQQLTYATHLMNTITLMIMQMQ